ncbi:energy transducer TonB [Nitratireductor soli]|uniref:energy transducer TonB n=1 Tax=Nitratireductor soli TaxID=1670619 RepID=UPI00065E9757|nr:energy transducer TonB [Nitratireductor soli]
MTVWPDLKRPGPAEAEPVASPSDHGRRLSPPPLDVPQRGVANDNAPPVPPAAGPAATVRGKALTGGIMATLLVSILAHAGIVAFLAEHWPVEGMEAAADAVSVELILEAPPTPPEEPVISEQAIQPEDEPETRNAPDLTPIEEPVEAENESSNNDLSDFPESSPLQDQPVETPASPVDEIVLPPLDPARSAVLATPPPVPLPADAVPVPTPRPTPPVVRKAPATHKASPPRRQAAKPQAAKPAPANSRSAGRQGGATKGEQAAYARRLLGHVQRHKRYPRAAERQNITGSANLSITIDRAGRLAGVRLRKGSGDAVLDQEALATARRAAPYPRPPEGVGGKTISFSVKLDFRRSN